MVIRIVLKGVLVALILWLPLAGSAQARSSRGEKGARPAAGGERKVLGELDLRTPSGRQLALIPLVGTKAIVVVFWDSRCDSCKKDVARLNEIARERLVKVVAVNERESAQKISSFIDKNGIGYDVIVDPDGAVANAFQVEGVPSCVILGRSGLIVYRGRTLPEEIDYYLAQ